MSARQSSQLDNADPLVGIEINLPRHCQFQMKTKALHDCRSPHKSGCDICGALRARRLLDENVSLERAWTELNDPRDRPTPQVTIEAVWHCIRERGAAALTEPANTARLDIFDDAARAELQRRIAALRRPIEKKRARA